jgi:two-component system sensor histidine kinase VicK
MVAIIARNARRLQRLTEDILDVTRIEGKTLNLNKHDFVLVEVTREMVEDYATNIRNSNRNIIISFSSSKELGSTLLFADQDRIKQVLSNLIDNAIKFTEQGTISVTAEIENMRDHLTVRVKDTGRGIDPQILPMLFTKFATKSNKGTGLGLYICKGIIEAHGGRIYAENTSEMDDTNDGGAKFSFILPLTYS